MTLLPGMPHETKKKNEKNQLPGRHDLRRRQRKQRT